MFHSVLNMPLVSKPFTNPLEMYSRDLFDCIFFLVFLHYFLWIGETGTVFELSEKE